MAYCLAVRPADGDRTWTVVDASYATVGPVEEWLEAHRHLWSPNTVRGYAASLAQWWSFLEQRGEAGRWAEAGVPAVAGFLSWAGNPNLARVKMMRPRRIYVSADLERLFADYLTHLVGRAATTAVSWRRLSYSRPRRRRWTGRRGSSRSPRSPARQAPRPAMAPESW